MAARRRARENPAAGSSRRRRRRAAARRQAVAIESLEQRLVLSGVPAADEFGLTAGQATALVRGITAFSDRLTEVQEVGLLGREAVAIGQPIGTLMPIGTALRSALVAQMGSLDRGVDTTVGAVKAAFAAAVAADPALARATVTATIEDDARLWFSVDLAGSTSLPDYRLDLGQTPGTAAAPSLVDRGLRLGEVTVELAAGYEGTLGFGIDLAAGLSAEQTFLLEFDDLRAFGSTRQVGADAVADVAADFGLMRLGPADLDVALDVGVTIDLREPATGWLTLGELNAATAAGWLGTLSFTATGAGLDVGIPFTLDMAGFDQPVGSVHEVGIAAADILAPGSLALVFPALSVTSGGGVTPFDFARLAAAGGNDLGGLLADLDRWVPELGAGFELPVVGRDLAAVTAESLREQLGATLAALEDAAGEWRFSTVQEMIDGLVGAIGGDLTAADFGLAWNQAAGSVEWTLPLGYTVAVTERFDAGSILPAGMPLSVAGRGSAAIHVTADYAITAGVSLAPVEVPSITRGTLLSALNGGAGLTRGMLIAGPDLLFTLRSGATVAVDLDPLPGLSDGTTPGTATVGDLLDWVNAMAAGKITLAVEGLSLVATDNTVPASPEATFGVVGPTREIVVAGRTTTESSLAALALGLVVRPVAGNRLAGTPLGSFSLRDRLYVTADSVGTFTIELDARLEAGAALGPLALAVDQGRAIGAAGVVARLADPGTGAAADGRLFLAEMEAGLAGLVGHEVVAPVLHGVFQLRVQPQSVADGLGIIAGDYREYLPVDPAAEPLTPGPDPLLLEDGGYNASTATVPYVFLAPAAAGGWSFTAEPSEKLAQLATGLADVSIDDLPGLLEQFVGYLERTGLWTFDLPWIDVSLGEIFDFASLFGALSEFDLGDLFGLPDGYDAIGNPVWPEYTLGRLGGGFLTAFNLALPDLSGLDPALFGRLEGLSWSLDNLIGEWEGWTPGSPDLDFALLGRIKAWFAEAAVVFPDLWAAWKSDSAPLDFTLAFGKLLWLPQFSWPAPAPPSFNAGWLAGLSFPDGRIDVVFPGLDFGGLSGFGRELARLGPAADASGPRFSLETETVGGRLVFTLLVDIDYVKPVAIPALDLRGLPLAVSQDGSLTLALGGTITGVFGVDLGTGEFFFDDAASRIDLTAEIDDGGGLVLGANLGGLAGVSLGSDAPDRQKARVRLGRLEADGTVSPGGLAVTGAGEPTSDIGFDVRLPLYVDPIGYAGTLGFDAQFVVAPPPPGGRPGVSFDLRLLDDEPFADGYDGTDTGKDGNPDFTSLLDVVRAATFDMDTWIYGATSFAESFRDGIARQLLAGLPLVGGLDLSEVGLLATIEDLFGGLAGDGPAPATPSGLWAALGAAVPEGSAFEFALDGAPFADGHSDWNKSFADIVSGDTEFVVNLTLTSTDTTRLGGEAIDFGVEALGIEIVGDADIGLTTTFTLDLGLGASLTRGFFLEAGEGAEFTATVGLALPERLSLKLGPLVFAAADASADPDLEAELSVDLGSGSHGLADLADLFADLDVGGTVRAEVAADLSANIFGDDGPGLGLGLALGYTASAAPGGGAVDVASLALDRFFFEITDTFIDLNGLLGGPVQVMLARVEAVLKPLQPVIDLLTSEVPVVSDISKVAGAGSITVLDMMRLAGGEEHANAVGFLENLVWIADTAGSLSGDLARGKVSLGGTKMRGTAPGTDAAALRMALSAAKLPSTHPDWAGEGIEAGPPASGGSGYATVTDGGFAFPIFDKPTDWLLDLLFGGNPDIVVWDLPDLRAGFELEQLVPLFPPLFARFFGGFEFATDLSLGYDTRGIRQAMAGEEVLASRVVNGIYFGDVADVANPASSDKPELAFTATVGAGALLEVAVARAGADAGVRGTLGANLKDANADGKVHLDELLVNLRSGPECIFDFEGSIDAFFEAAIRVGFSTPFGFVTLWSDRYDLLGFNLYDWRTITCPPVAPVLFEVYADDGSATSDGTPDVGWEHDGVEQWPGDPDRDNVRALVINAGPRAGKVFPGETEDGDEAFEIDMEDGQIVVRGYDSEQRHAATGIDWIWFDAGLGNDTVTVSSRVTIPVWGYGGPGNDRLTGGAGPNTLFGDGGGVAGADGRDRLLGRGGADTLQGGGGDDMLVGYGGADILQGGAGADQLIGDDEAGDMSEAPEGFTGTAGDDQIEGGDDNDTILAGDGADIVDGGFGDDTIDGGAGNDLIEGGAGVDKLYGRAGDDRIYGEDQEGRITAVGRKPGDGSGLTVNADLIEGGTGFNYLDGGPGFDIIYADSEAAGVGVVPVHAAVDIVARSTAPGRGFTTPLVAAGSRHFHVVIVGGDGDDTIYGTAGRDYIDGGFESDYLEAGEGADYLLGGPGSDAIFAGGGADLVYAGDGRDVVDGGAGDDTIEGGPESDEIFAREGADTVYGGTTAWGYDHYLADRSGSRSVQESLHGGFTAVLAADSCGPEVFFHPEVYPESPYVLTGELYEDLNANGRRDPGEPDTPADQSWGLVVTSEGELAALDEGVTGRFSYPAEGGVAAGSYQLLPGWTVIAGILMQDIPDGWFASTPIAAAVTVDAETPPVTRQFGYYRLGSIQGEVLDPQKAPLAGVTVGLDTDGDGGADSLTRTAADGTYFFPRLVPGAYTVSIVDPAACGYVATPSTGSREVVVTSGAAATAGFIIAAREAPVVAAVEIGTSGEAATWRTIPGGPEQLDPLPAATYRSFAIEICSATGLAPEIGNARLYPVDGTGKLGAAIPLTFRGFDPAQADRLLYDLPAKTDGAETVLAGRYRLVIPEVSIRAASGAPLDGEWTNPGPGAALGDWFPSGNNQAGGDFVFDLVVAKGAVAGMAVLGGGDGWTASGQAQLATVQGTVWVHDARDADPGQSATEPALVGQTVRLLDGAGAVVQTQVSRPIDLDGDGRITGGEQAAFRFSDLAPGDYVVVEEPIDPWAQATPGGVLRGTGWYAVTHGLHADSAAAAKNVLWSVATNGTTGVQLHEFARLKARDIAMFAHGTAWLVGEATAGNAMAAGTSGLWRIDVVSGAVTEVGPTPGDKPLLSLDVLDDDTLLGLSSDGRVFTYDVTAGAWSDLGPLLSAANVRCYPVGDAAVVAADEVYIVCTLAPNDTLDNKFAASQFLVRLDATVRGANTTVVRNPLVASEMFIGTEIGSGGGLMLLGANGGLYGTGIAGGPLTRNGQLLPPTGNRLLFGGLTAAPPEIVLDAGRTNFVLTITGSERVEIGFGNVPVFSDLHDGGDTIDGGCEAFADVLHGDNGSDLPWQVRVHGGDDEIRGRAGDDIIRGGQGGDRIRGEEGNDDLVGGDSGPNRIDGGDGNDAVVGGAAADTLAGGLGHDTLSGHDGGDTILGGGGDDTLFGGRGDDTLVGGGGTDSVFGEAGMDLLVVVDVPTGGAYAEDPRGLGKDLYDGGADRDTILVSADIAITLANATLDVFGVVNDLVSIEHALLTGGKSGNTISAATFGGTTVLRGLGGDDTLTGGLGADLIIGGSGTNLLTGGLGDDTYLVASGCTDTIAEVAGAGRDTVDLAAISGPLELRLGTLKADNLIQGLATGLPGAAAVRVNLGTSPPERIVLGSGNDSIMVKKAAATTVEVDGGPGSDTILYTSATAGWSWINPVVVDLARGLATGLGGLANVENAEGGLGGDRLFGNDSANVLRGHGGDDEIRGGNGDDQLFGMDGDDDLYGDGDSDRLVPGPGANYLDGGSGSDTYVFAVDGQIDTVDDTLGGLADTLDFSGIATTGIDFSIGAVITATFGGSSVTAGGTHIDVVKGSAKTDRFRIANGSTYAGILDGAGAESAAFAALDTLDYTAWNSTVTVSFVGIVADSGRAAATGTGGVRGLRHVIGGGGDDSFKGGGLPVWFEGRAGSDRLDGSTQGDLLDGGNDADTLNGLAGDDILLGGWGGDTLSGGRGDDTYSFADLFGTDTISENPGEGSDTMDFAAVTLPLEVRLGSVTVTAGGSTATHAGDAIERVIGGSAADAFVMTGPTVVFPGILDGGGGTNSLVYRRATPAVVAAVEAGQLPNLGGVANIATVVAEPMYTLVAVPVPAGATLIDPVVRTGDERLVKTGGGKLILTQANSHTSGTVIEAGEVVIRNVAALGSGGLEVLAGAIVTLDVGFGTVPLAELVLAAGATLEVGAGRITIAAGATEAAVRQWLIAGRAGGGWNGSAGIRSAAAAGTPASRALGYRVNADGSAVVMFTAVGDTNLDGSANVFDLVGVNTGGRYGSLAAANWSDGDMNYDGRVNGFDLVAINAGGGFNRGPVSGSASSAFAALAEPAVADSVAEPSQTSVESLPQAFAALAVEEWGISATGSTVTKKKVGAPG